MSKGNYYSGSPGASLGGLSGGCCITAIFLFGSLTLIGCGVTRIAKLSLSKDKNQPKTEQNDVEQDTVRKGWVILVGEALPPDTIIYKSLAQKEK